MIFESVNYSYLLQDFVFSMGAGFGAAFVTALMFLPVPYGKRMLFFRDAAGCFVLAVAVFSYVVSFANYPDIRIYHIIGGFAGYLCFPNEIFLPVQKFSKKIFVKIFDNILCATQKLWSTICGLAAKHSSKTPSDAKEGQSEDLKTEEVWVYNL